MKLYKHTSTKDTIYTYDEVLQDFKEHDECYKHEIDRCECMKCSGLTDEEYIKAYTNISEECYYNI